MKKKLSSALNPNEEQKHELLFKVSRTCDLLKKFGMIIDDEAIELAENIVRQIEIHIEQQNESYRYFPVSKEEQEQFAKSLDILAPKNPLQEERPADADKVNYAAVLKYYKGQLESYAKQLHEVHADRFRLARRRDVLLSEIAVTRSYENHDIHTVRNLMEKERELAYIDVDMLHVEKNHADLLETYRLYTQKLHEWEVNKKQYYENQSARNSIRKDDAKS